MLNFNEILNFKAINRHSNLAENLFEQKEFENKYTRKSMLKKTFSVFSMIAKHITKYPAPLGLTLGWTFGSLSFMALIIQIVSGVCLTMHYVPSVELAFDSVEHIMRDVYYGHMIRYVHANGASFYFVCVYCHIFRSLYYKTFLKNILTWQIGVVILILSMAAAFLGYVLPWGQMSFWGATVITNLFSVIPVAGADIVNSMWGGFGVGGPTLNRFYTLHFVIPLIIFALVIVHILLLHDAGSSSPQNNGAALDRGTFGGLFILKDVFLISYGLVLFTLFLVFGPNVLNHPDNYNPADPMQTPPHIVPEWYFLPFYAVLRAIPNKAAGVIAMGVAIAFFFLLPTIGKETQRVEIRDNNKFRAYEKMVFWGFTVNALLLGYLGGMSIEWPYNYIALICFFMYFILGALLASKELLASITERHEIELGVRTNLLSEKDVMGGNVGSFKNSDKKKTNGVLILFNRRIHIKKEPPLPPLLRKL